MNTFPSKKGTIYFNLHFTNKDAQALKLNNLPKVTNWYVTKSVNPNPHKSDVRACAFNHSPERWHGEDNKLALMGVQGGVLLVGS